MELLGAGPGLGRLLSSATSYGGRLQLFWPPDPYGGGYGGGYGGYDDLPLDRRPGGAAYGGFGTFRQHGPLGGAVCGLVMGMSNGSAAPGGVLGVGGFDFDDASPQFPAAPDTLRGDSLHGLPALAVATVRLEVVQVENPVVPVRLRETPQALMVPLCCSRPSEEVWAMRAVLPVRLRLLQ